MSLNFWHPVKMGTPLGKMGTPSHSCTKSITDVSYDRSYIPIANITRPPVYDNTRSMQGMFGASVSELYLVIKSLINIERAVDLCVSDDKVLPIDERLQNGHKLLN